MSHVHYQWVIVLVLVACLAFFTACGGAGQNTSQSTNTVRTGGVGQAAGEVTVYVSTDRVFSEPILRAFEQRTGVHVNAVYDTEETKSTGLANKLLAEKNRPQADVFWSNEPVRTLVLKKNGVLAPYQSPNAEGIPATFKNPEGYWTGFSARSRVIVYHTKASPSLPSARRSSWLLPSCSVTGAGGHAGTGDGSSILPLSSSLPCRAQSSGWD